VIAVNLTGVFLMCRAAIPAMQDGAADGASIVNLASAAALRGWSGMDAYTASKGGVVSLTRSLAMEYAPGIRVNAVCPGAVETPLTADEQARRGYPRVPLGRVGRPEDIAGTICHLASDDAAYMTGEVLVVDGGRLARQ